MRKWRIYISLYSVALTVLTQVLSTAVFVLACLQQIDATEKAVRVLVICHTRELAYQIKHEFDRFSKYFAEVNTGVMVSCMEVHLSRRIAKC